MRWYDESDTVISEADACAKKAFAMDENIARQFQVFVKDPDHYVQLAIDQWSEVHTYPPYWRILPTYQVSRYPFTGISHTEVLGTYSLGNWRNEYSNGTRIRYATEDPIHSEHFVAVQAFLNLEGHEPQRVMS